MAKYKEEIVTVTTKHYYPVQKQELESLDTLKLQRKAFEANVKSTLKEYKDHIKSVDKEQSTSTADFKAKHKDLVDQHAAHVKQVEENKATAQKQLDKELADHVKAHNKEISDLDKAITKINSAHVKRVEKLEDELAKLLETASKHIVDIEEKGVKDEATFTKKLADLEVKYNDKVAALDEKEEDKKTKLAESTKQKVASIQEMIEKEQVKQTKKLSTKQALYEAELEEIDEKITFEKGDYESKLDNIKTSVEKRIAVREKHLQRAIKDNDKRSQKQHKKDIQKFEKEAENDLAVLERNYKKQEQESANYRKQFIKDYYEDVAKQEKTFAEYQEDKQHSIHNEELELEHTLVLAKLEYDVLRAKELNEYNESFAQIREKQETAIMQRNLAIQQEHHNEAEAKIENEKAKNIAEKELSDELETKEKERRVVELEKQKADDVSNNSLEEAHVRLDNEQFIADSQLERDQAVLNFEEQIALHTFQHQRHTGIKNEFNTYQQYLGPKFVNRTKEVQTYKVQELDVRLERQSNFFEQLIADLEHDYQQALTKVEQTHEDEASYVAAKIESIAGDKTVELQEFVETNEEELRELQAEINSLTDSTQRKERKQKDQLLAKKRQAFETEKAKREDALNQEIGAFKTLHTDVLNRKEVALEDLKLAYQQSRTLLETELNNIKENAIKEREEAEHLSERTEEVFNAFNLQVANRNQQQGDAHTAYLAALEAKENASIQITNSEFDRKKDQLNDEMQQKLSALSLTRQDILATYKSNVDQQEQALEGFKQQVQTDIDVINQTVMTKQSELTEAFTTEKNTMSNDLNEKIGEIKNALSNQTNDFNQTLDDLDKQKDKEDLHFLNEQKTLAKESSERLKEAIREIQATLQTHIQSI